MRVLASVLLLLAICAIIDCIPTNTSWNHPNGNFKFGKKHGGAGGASQTESIAESSEQTGSAVGTVQEVAGGEDTVVQTVEVADTVEVDDEVGGKIVFEPVSADKLLDLVNPQGVASLLALTPEIIIEDGDSVLKSNADQGIEALGLAGFEDDLNTQAKTLSEVLDVATLSDEMLKTAYTYQKAYDVNTGGRCYAQTYYGADFTSVVSDEVRNFCEIETMNLTTAQFAWVESLSSNVHKMKSCDDTTQTKSFRREIRRYSVAERKAIYQSIVDMKTTMIDDMSEYDIFVLMHRPASGPSGTRAGPATWGWHREYLYRFERAMKSHNPDVTLPYWDITLDVYNPQPRDSQLFSTVEFGQCGFPNRNTGRQIRVVDGPFANWTLYDSCYEFYLNDEMLTRSCHTTTQGFLIDAYTDWDWNYVMNMSSFTTFSTDMCMLHDHDNMHGFVGGVSSYEDEKSCAVEDPILWFMHTYLDYVWQSFRDEKQKNRQSQ